ncbi:unnamed protein product [Mytilus coruscus]|uniref:Uncharacterized protein n=1 Tax=Mytilus coruscus TaxID=42192 RepID=A0A6J8CYH1_MYTCO|nr:unnamed protein product [Mytilus coruscus]
MADEKEEHSKWKRHSSNDSRLLHFYEVNQQHCCNEKLQYEIVYEARLENVDNFTKLRKRTRRTVSVSRPQTEPKETSPYSDVSSEDDSESSNSDIELDEQEQPKSSQSHSSTHTSNTKNDTMSVIEDMKGFMVTEEKAGPKINDELASVVNDGLRKKAKQNKVDELTKKYAKPENVHSLTVPKINLGIWSQMSVPNRMNDVKLQKIQNLLGKAACPMLYSMDLFLSKSQTNDGLSREEVQSATQLCKDAYQMTQVTYADITFRRRALIQAEIEPKYKALCKDDVPVTDFLFGNDIKDKVKEMDAEYTVGKKLGKTNF